MIVRVGNGSVLKFIKAVGEDLGAHLKFAKTFGGIAGVSRLSRLLVRMYDR